MRYVLIPTAAFVAAAVCAVYFALQHDPKPPVKPAVLARSWDTPEIERNFAPMKPVQIALHTPQGWIVVSGCKALSQRAYNRAFILCK